MTVMLADEIGIHHTVHSLSQSLSDGVITDKNKQVQTVNNIT